MFQRVRCPTIIPIWHDGEIEKRSIFRISILGRRESCAIVRCEIVACIRLINYSSFICVADKIYPCYGAGIVHPSVLRNEWHCYRYTPTVASITFISTMSFYQMNFCRNYQTPSVSLAAEIPLHRTLQQHASILHFFPFCSYSWSMTDDHMIDLLT